MKKLKKRLIDWKFYIIAAMVITVFFSIAGLYFSNALNKYLYTQLVNEAMHTSDMNRFTISTINRSINHIEDLLVEKLELAGKSIIGTATSPEDTDVIHWVEDHYGIDEINWFSNEGVILYSTEDYEGMIMESDHVVWLLLENNVDYFVEDVRKDVMSDKYFLFLYMKVSDGSVVQLSIDAARLNELTDQFSFENHLQEILKDQRIRSTLVHIKNGEQYTIYGFGNGTYHLTSSQWERIINQVHDQQITTLDGESVLEVYVPIEENGVAIGTYFVVYSLAETEAFVDLSTHVIVLLLLLVFLVTGILLYVIYKRNRAFEDMAYRDESTGFYNRTYLVDKYSDFKGVPEEYRLNSVVYLLKNLKRLELVSSQEDIKKHIIRFSEVLKQFGESNEIYRYAEDVFIVVYRNKPMVDIIRTINNLFENIESELDLKAGIIQDTDPIVTLQDVIRSVDLTTVKLREEKEARYLLMDEGIKDEILLDQRLELDLRRLSATGFGKELHVEFQPQVDTIKNKVVGFETLTRWHHPELGYISPPIIFSIAERNDFDTTLSRWVLTETLHFIKKLDEAGYNDMVVSFNASISVIEQKGFVHNLMTMLGYEGIPAERLGVEITETRIDTESGILAETIKKLRSYGVHVAIDDYGRGYSSLIRLKNLDVGVVKIDKSFIDDIGHDERFIKSIMEMARNMDLSLIAEGVETEAQLKWLKDNNCIKVQGFYFSKALKTKDALIFTDKFNQ